MKDNQEDRDLRDYQAPLTDEQAEQMERGLRRLLNTPPQPHGKRPGEQPPKSGGHPDPKVRTRKIKSPS